jgi:hypothetical protein
VPDRASQQLWAITCYFNPMGYQSRLANYHTFRQRLAVPLIAVEFAEEGQFQLDKNDAEILIQRNGSQVLWQKERLLNIALDAVPSDCRLVAWLDCDVVFDGDDWIEQAAAELDRVPLLQCFCDLYDLPCPPLARRASEGNAYPSLARRANGAASVSETVDLAECHQRQSLIFLYNSGAASGEIFRGGQQRWKRKYTTGHAWAARRVLLERHGFYDAGILGGGDRAMAGAAFGQFSAAAQNWPMNSRQFDHYVSWAQPFFDDVQGRVRFLDATLYHLWHGPWEGRAYSQRYVGLEPFQFDPFTDIALADNGCWRWNSDKPAMHQYVRDYFAARKEDVSPTR